MNERVRDLAVLVAVALFVAVAFLMIKTGRSRAAALLSPVLIYLAGEITT